MNHIRRAFTLIELLVVIAIIAILAAILFPVFAQAKAAAKTANSISNTKQIGLGQQMYTNDTDDVLPARRFCLINQTPNVEYSWKQAEYPYIKNTGIFRDTVNTSAQYLDDTSEPLILAADGYALPANTGEPQFARGYAMNNIGFYMNGKWDLFSPCQGAQPGFYLNTYSYSQIDQAAAVSALFEHKVEWVDTGSYIGWQNSATNPINDDDGVLRYSGWNWGGSKWDDKAQAMVYLDGHSKRTANDYICGLPGDQVTPFGWTHNDLSNHAPGGDMSWLHTFCDTLPAGL